ncbi:DEHA2E21208p [Debaryomyces hansenii CBS767]|uniref:Nuclear fusion protein KAR5 n=1 Tax=Debaryomyces hansenii (strain ATCC 36239 / CBS 767 / BCRC 21394 / JCM 1990 / NBRC 0083 / IGC 2968) TaxID=284592 RepID=KAR5_DEBHA|nr:DEHA2E21208p [Debaryomyces hansenii CBS767]Q6BNJ4.2 RecName: Full=Nuclear fusion protein KAR5; AltName: Full=Karyogamy protein 5; Flags: Precursor [Debaryomyces hansenii CBS767]CAG88499.2 DEHA2E21208p [Debaryomyces hansenii CBS767]|eukprot:XP_460226.2 DEHA2E21208p [Debaryomyces hansenii CBS767]
MDCVNISWFLITLFAAIATSTMHDGENNNVGKMLQEPTYLQSEMIESIMSRHLESFSLTESDFEDIIFMKPRSKCVKDALKDIIPECMRLGVDSIEPGLQKKAAIQLSICEFENSKVTYPSSCYNMINDNDFDSCIFDIERAPQYWTTFSGYYREITKICYEESLPFEKEQIISLYSNITKLYSKMFQDLNDSYKDSTHIQQMMKNEFKELQRMMKVILDQNEKTSEEVKEKYEEFSEQYSSMLSTSLEISKKFSLGTENLVEDMANNIKYLDFELSRISIAIEDLDFETKLTDMKNSVLDDVRNLSDESISLLDSILTNLESLDILSQDAQNITNGISQSLKKNEVLSNNMNNALIETDTQLHEHNEVIRFEFEETISYLSQFSDQAIDNAIRDTSEEITKHVATFIDSINLRLEETTTKLEEVIYNIDDLSDKVGNASSYLIEGLNLLTSNGIMDALLLTYNNVASGLESGFGMLTTLKSDIFKIVRFITACILFAILFIWSMNRLFSQNRTKHTTLSSISPIGILNFRRIFRFLTNLALWLSVMGGTLLAVIVTNFLIQLKVYISKLSTND